MKHQKSIVVRQRVIAARKIQNERFKQYSEIHSNAQMSSTQVRERCQIDQQGTQLLKVAMEKLGLSARAYDRILKVARTIADMEQETNIQNHHLAEAIQYRSLDRENWAG